VTGSKIYQVKLWTSLETSLTKLIKAHYRKNRQSLVEFNLLIENCLKNLAINPRGNESREEPFPKCDEKYKQGVEFHIATDGCIRSLAI
jgi:hypothetical protein